MALAWGFRSHGNRKVVSTVLSKHSKPQESFLNAPVTADRIWAALSGEATDRVVLILGRTAIVLDRSWYRLRDPFSHNHLACRSSKGDGGTGGGVGMKGGRGSSI